MEIILLIFNWLLSFRKKEHESSWKHALSFTNDILFFYSFKASCRLMPNALATPAPYAGSSL